MAAHLLRTEAQAVDDRKCGPWSWHYRLFGNLSTWALRKVAVSLESHV